MNEKSNIDRAKLLNLLEYINKHTAENPAQTPALMSLFNVSERQLRMMIAHARTEYHASIASNPTGGYFRAGNWQEYRRTFTQRIHQAVAEIKTQNVVRKSLINDLQPTIFDAVNYATEFDDLIEFVEGFTNQSSPQQS